MIDFFLNINLAIMVFSPWLKRNTQGYLTESICDSFLAIAIILFLNFNMRSSEFRIILLVLTTVYFMFDIYRCLVRVEYLTENYALTFLFYAFLYTRLLLK